eukprot:3142862-Prymnesium_polylepis.1
MRCQNVGGQAKFSHFPAFSFDSEPGRFPRNFLKMYGRGNVRRGAEAALQRSRTPAEGRYHLA